MLIQLIKYEFIKKWKVFRYALLGYIFIEIMILIITRIFLWDTNITKMFVENNGECKGVGVAFAVTMILYFGLAIFIGMFSIFEGIYRFGRDLSGKQSVLGLMIPIISWKKVISKIIINLCSNIACIVLSILSIIIFILINSNFEKSIASGILKFIREAFHSPAGFVLASLYIIFCFASAYTIIFCCVAFSKSISHKSKISIPIGILSLACFIAAGTFINTLLVERIPIINYNLLGTKDSLSSTVMSVLIFFGALLGTSWLMENKIEH